MISKTLKLIVKRYKAGVPIADIATEVGLSKRTIQYWIMKEGLAGTRGNDNQRYIRKTGKTKVQLIREMVAQPLMMGSCVHCGYKNWLALQYDHLERTKKKFSIADVMSNPYRYSLKQIKKELAKCQILCANCHTIRTTKQRKVWRLDYKNEQE